MLIDSPDNVGEDYGKANSPIQGFGQYDQGLDENAYSG